MNEIQRAAPSHELVEAMKAHVSRAAKGSSDAEIAAFVAVCHQMGLNPIVGEVHAMRDKSGTLRPVPSIDGWVKVTRSQPDFRGIEFEENRDEEGLLVSITCTIHVDGWATPCRVTEYLLECRRRTDPWQSMPTRMLRHRALIQCARVAFGLGLSDVEDVRDEPHAEPTPTATKPERGGLAELQSLIADTEETITDADLIP
jgi:phage recombination protein Bet